MSGTKGQFVKLDAHECDILVIGTADKVEVQLIRKHTFSQSADNVLFLSAGEIASIAHAVAGLGK